jgi:carbonic anhydrase
MPEHFATHSGLGPLRRQSDELELTRPDRQNGAGIAIALGHNRAFAAANGHEGASLFPNLGLLVITCLDARVDPAHILGLELGDALVLRNNGGRVTPQLIDDLAYVSQLADAARPEGDLFEVAVIQHTQCGVARLADDAFRRQYAARIGADESSLREYAILDPAASIARDVELLRSAGSISPRLTFSGHVYDVVTGLVETVIPAAKSRRA